MLAQIPMFYLGFVGTIMGGSNDAILSDASIREAKVHPVFNRRNGLLIFPLCKAGLCHRLSESTPLLEAFSLTKDS